MTDRFRPGGAADCSCTVELSISCKNLADMDILSKSDPMCVLFVKESGGRDGWHEYGRTEIIWNNLNPEFATKFHMNYFFEERQHLRFEIYDIDCKSDDLRKHDFLGRADVTLGEVVSVWRLTKSLKDDGQHRNGAGIIIITAEELAVSKEEVTMQVHGRKLDRKDFFGKSDPYLALYKVNEDNTYTVVHRTEVIKNTVNPIWKPFTLPLRALCGGDYNRSILIRCYDWNRDGKEKLIGEFVTNLQALSQGSVGGDVFFELINPKMKQKKNYKSSGTLIMKSIQIKPVVTFLDYVQAGTELNCTIAIDFTASNGDPTKPTSLHYIHPYTPNQYQRALMAVGEVIQDYDSDKLFPVLGFGARLPPNGQVSHNFFVNGHPSNPYCEGMEGVIEAYQRCLRCVQLYGPTNFASVITHVARLAASKRDGSEYFILLIITDGVITDMPQTKEAIVNAAVLPLSIIIVGVGDADFEAMRELDGDTVRLSSNGRFAERDIVQFVPFREFLNGGRDGWTTDVAQTRLAKEVLAEIPDQFVSYMKKNKITPGAYRRSSQANLNRIVAAPRPTPATFPSPTVIAIQPNEQQPTPSIATASHQPYPVTHNGQDEFSPPPPYSQVVR